MEQKRTIAAEYLCIHEVFQRVVHQYPKRISVVCGDTRWSYAQLNRQANKVAHALQDIGIGQGEPVAIALPRSCEYIAAMLGVLKAGGAYVPIVDNQPLPRLRKMVGNCGARCMIGAAGYLDTLHKDIDHLLTTDDCAAQPDTDLAIERSPNDLAYIMYTSGSTGDPKGVMIEHDGVLRLVHDQWFMPVGPDINYLCVSSFGFDASTIEIYAALLHGATLAITTHRVPEPDEVRRLIRDEQISAVWIAFGFFGALFEADPAMFESVRVVMTGGEPVTADLIRRAQRTLPNTRFVNSYGPTECTSLSTAYQIPALDGDVSGMLPIGRALRGMQTRVVDEQGIEVGVGETGELLITGIGIARGYLNASELTAERFLTDTHGRRTYRSGDLVRVLDDGNLMFLGRIDSQVKLRGNRFELGEVESVARRFMGITNCIACLIERNTVPRLALLVVGPTPIDHGALRKHIAQHLPEYMTPDVIEQAQAIPLTRNGKADRDAIQNLIESRQPVGTDGIDTGHKLGTDTERVLAELMEGVLGCPVRSHSDRFLELGGHSLRAVVLSSRIHDTVGVRLPISAIYEHPSVGELAAHLDRVRENQAGPGREEPIERVGDGRSSLLSFNQQRLWMHDRMHQGDPSYTITIRLDHSGNLDRDAFDRAWSFICERHDVLRARIGIVDDAPTQMIDEQVTSQPVWTDCSRLDRADIDSMVLREASRGFDLDTGPLVRCLVLQESDNASVILSMHHIISDAWSCEILQRELRAVYRQLIAGDSPDLPLIPVRYSDYARWERALVHRSSYDEHLNYWNRQLKNAPMLRLPADYRGSTEGANAGVRTTAKLERESLDQIRSASHSMGVTPFVYMLAVFKAWLHRLTLGDDIVVGAPVANRERTEVEGLVGFFMETLPLRDQVRDDDSLRCLIHRVRSTALEAFDHRDVPFQHIVESLGIQGQPGHNPLFEVFFNHISIQMQGTDTSDGVLVPRATNIDNRYAKFDLTCYIFEEDDHAQVIFNARRSRFGSPTVEWYMHQFLQLLKSSPEHLDTPIPRIPLDMSPISSPEPARVPAPSLPVGVRTDGSIVDVIERVVMKNGKRITARSDSGTLCYAQLWERSGTLAQELVHCGIEHGDRVLVGTRETIHTCIATLAVLRAGAVFIPTDPHWPTQRLQQIIDLSRPKRLITDFDIESACSGVQTVRIDEHSGESSFRGEQIRPDAPAYILFTSGSTGLPKGVVQTHSAVVGHMQTFAHSICLRPDDQLLQMSSFAFDASIMDMFGCWFTGAALCVRDPRNTPPLELIRWINEHRLSVLHAAPTLMRWFTSALPADATMPTVRAVVMGGEPAVDHDLDSILTHFTGCDRFINGLGLTESSLNLQYRVDPRDLTDPPGRIPVGFPVEGVSVRLLDAAGNTTGPTGEIEIESDRVATGYIVQAGDETLPIGTAHAEACTRRFRTGDIGTIRHDGSIMHLGRRDDQVQVRGCRVEPGEVAHALRSLDMIQDAAVIPVAAPDDGHALRAFVVCGPECKPDSIRQRLADELPPYMIPDEYVRVEAIPRVGGGKVDRNALRTTEHLQFADESPIPALSITPETRIIMDAFSHVLELDPIEPESNFFRSGGNSLRAIMLFNRLHTVMKADLPISVIYRSPTPAMLAREFLLAQDRDSGHDDLIELKGSTEARRIIVLPGIGGHPLGFAPLLDRVQTSAHFVGVQYPDEETAIRIGRNLPALAAWVIERLDLKPGDPAPDLIGYSFGGSLGLEIAMQLTQGGRTPGRLILLDAHLPIGLPKKGKLGTARAHLACIVEGHETSRLAYIGKRLKPGMKNRQPIEQEGKREHSELHGFKANARINRQMVLEYRPATRYHAPVLLIRAVQPDWLRFHHDDGVNGYSSVVDPELVTRVDIDAEHLELFKPGPAEQIAGHVDRWLQEPRGW